MATTRRMSVLLLSVTLASSGCASQAPAKKWFRADGQSVLSDPVLLQRGELDVAVCAGEKQRAQMSGPAPDNMFAAGVRANRANDVMIGCMADRGYVLR